MISLHEAIAIVVTRTGVARYRFLCSDANPDTWSREGYRRWVLEQAGQPAPEPSPPTPEDLALRAHVVRHGGCCH